MIDPRIEQFLARRGGLVAEALGEGAVQATLERRARDLGVAVELYPERLDEDPREAAEFLEDVLIPETWFYRDSTPFLWITEQALQGRWRRPLRALSLPCASGEEAYSIAIALREAGVAPGQIEVEGWDLSERALERARRGLYGPFSLRGVPGWLVERHLRPAGAGVEAPPELRALARFEQRNALETGPVGPDFDLILCRNLLIYLGVSARRQLLAALAQRLAPQGVLILGHADGWPEATLGLRPVGPPGAFAHERGAPAHRPLAAPRAPSPRLPPSPPPAPPRTPSPGAAAPAQAQQLAEARQLADRGLLDEAHRRCAAYLERSPLDPAAHRLMGLLHVAKKSPREAEASLRRALYLDPEDEEALGHLALLLDHAGRSDQAALLRRRQEVARRRGST
jgi:chemotaxis protein methyltransferase WspC